MRSPRPTSPIRQKSLFTQVNDTDTLHVRRIFGDPNGIPVLFIHGVIENGRIYYSESGKGLAPYLAGHGYDCYVADLRGRGLSSPHVNRQSRYGQTEIITEDLPAYLKLITELRGDVPQHWIAHSWGGVLLSSYLARFPEGRKKVKSLAYFGAKRTIRVWNIHRLWMISFGWDCLFALLIALYGYVPAKRFRFGSDDEPAKEYAQIKAWVKPSPWIDPGDGFDYGAAIRNTDMPPICYLAAVNDHALGHPEDVSRFIQETGEHAHRYMVLSRANGNRHDYDHVNMLTHQDAVDDHFPLILEWLQGHE